MLAIILAIQSVGGTIREDHVDLWVGRKATLLRKKVAIWGNTQNISCNLISTMFKVPCGHFTTQSDN